MKKILFILGLFISFSIYSQTGNQQKPKDPSKIANEEKPLSQEQKQELIGNVFKKLWQREAEIETLITNRNYQMRTIDSLSIKVKEQQRIIQMMEAPKVEEKIIVINIPQNIPTEFQQSLSEDQKFLSDFPKDGDYSKISQNELVKMVKKIDRKLENLNIERIKLVQDSSSTPNLGPVIKAKDEVIGTLKKEKVIIQTESKNKDLTGKNEVLKEEKSKLKIYLYTSLSILFVLTLIIAVFLQRKTIKSQEGEIESQLRDINKKNNYLEHAARLIRHDMHSGINTYMPRGISSLEKRISENQAKELKIDTSLRMIREGLAHTQKVYKSVYEFTNLVKKQVVLVKTPNNLGELLDKYLQNTSYRSQVEIGELPTIDVNETLFCNAIDNLIKNGLKYNDSQNKEVKVYMEDNSLVIEDNGKGLSNEEFKKILGAYAKAEDNDRDVETAGLGLNICQAILSEHGFILDCQKTNSGTKMKIKL